jgi:hypothetical protein
MKKVPVSNRNIAKKVSFSYNHAQTFIRHRNKREGHMFMKKVFLFLLVFLTAGFFCLQEKHNQRYFKAIIVQQAVVL